MTRSQCMQSRLLAAGLAMGLAIGVGGGVDGAADDCRLCLEDVTGDMMVDVQDLSMVLDHWGCVDARLSFADRSPGEVVQMGRPEGRCSADCDDDGDVDVMDLVAVIMAWGAC